MPQVTESNPAPGSEAAHMALGLDPQDVKYLEVNLNTKRGMVVRGRHVE